MRTRLISRLSWVSFLCGLLLGSPAVRAQSEAYYQASPDSLRRVLAGQRTDTARLRTLQHLINLFPTEDSDVQQLPGLLHQLLPLLHRQRLPQYRAYRLWLAGAQLGQFASQTPPPTIRQALDSLQAAVHEFNHLGWYASGLFYYLSTSYAELHRPAAEQAFLTQQLGFYQRQPAHWQLGISFCLSLLGSYYEAHGDFNQEINCYLQKAEAEQNYAGALTKENYSDNAAAIGEAYTRWGNYAKAQQYLERALRAQPPPEQLSGLALYRAIYLEILLAKAYQQQHRLAAALQVVEEALRQYPRASAAKAYPITHVQLLYLKSSLLLDQQQTVEAGRLLRQGQHLARIKQLDTTNYLGTNGSWARYFAQRGQVERAQAAWQRAYQQARAAHSPRSVLYYARQIAQFYQAQHQPARAAPYALVALQLADSLAAQQGTSLVASYELVQAERAQAVRLAQTQRRQRQATAQAQHQRRALLYTGASVLGLLLLAGVLYAAFRRSQRLAQLVTAQRDQLDTSLSELRATQAQLLQKEKMASLGELTAGIAHEIQNPLNFVNNFSDVSAELVAELKAAQAAGDAAEVLALADDLGLNLTKISQHGQRASGIVRGMLEHSRASTGERQPTDVNALADEYLRLAYHGQRAKDQSFQATLETDLAPNLPLVEAVPGDLGRVLLNLFTNACYAVQQRQRAGEAGYVPTVRVQTRQVGQQVEIQVRDNGAGMSPEVQAKIFQPFFTTKPTGEGTGLGLSLSYDIIAQGHGGSLTVESAVGAGSTFTVKLPISRRASS